MPYRHALPTRQDVRSNHPKEMEELDSCLTSKEIDEFITFSKDQDGSEAYQQVARYATIKSVQAMALGPFAAEHDPYIEDCVAERIYYATLANGKMDKKTKQLIENNGYLKGMVEQLKPVDKVGKGNFITLKEKGVVDCTAEYCVWKWGRHLADPKLLASLNVHATRHSFK